MTGREREKVKVGGAKHCTHSRVTGINSRSATEPCGCISRGVVTGAGPDVWGEEVVWFEGEFCLGREVFPVRHFDFLFQLPDACVRGRCTGHNKQ